jgi:hypothetical protein
MEINVIFSLSYVMFEIKSFPLRKIIIPLETFEHVQIKTMRNKELKFYFLSVGGCFFADNILVSTLS